MKSPLFKNIGKGPVKENVRLNRRLVTFLFCLLISAFLWLMLSLSKEYNEEITFPVTITNFPIDRVVANELPENIQVEIRASGFYLLKYKYLKSRDTILIDAKGSRHLPGKNNFYLLTNLRLDKISAQLNQGVKALRVFPDTIFLNYNKKKSKKVPIKSKLKLDFAPLYQLADSVKLSPDFITVSGAAELVDKIRFVETKTVKLKKLSDTTTVELPIAKTKDIKLVELSDYSVKATVNVSKFTEASLEIPLEVEHLPKGVSLKTFPGKVMVTYTVALQNYESVTPMQFRAIVDYAKIDKKSNKLRVKLVKQPSEVKTAKVSPDKVEFIIRK